jgi:hypothetical protein
VAKRKKAVKRTTRKAAATATKEAAASSCTLDQICTYLQQFAPPPNKPINKPGFVTKQPEDVWLRDLYIGYTDLYNAVVQLEGYVLCNTPAQKPDPIIATNCRVGTNPPQKSGSPPPPPFP